MASCGLQDTSPSFVLSPLNSVVYVAVYLSAEVIQLSIFSKLNINNVTYVKLIWGALKALQELLFLRHTVYCWQEAADQNVCLFWKVPQKVIRKEANFLLAFISCLLAVDCYLMLSVSIVAMKRLIQCLTLTEIEKFVCPAFQISCLGFSELSVLLCLVLLLQAKKC